MTSAYYSTESSTCNHPWYAVRTFNCQERKVSRFLAEKDYVHFIPMMLAQETLVPAIHNLLFVQRKDSREEFIKDISECSIPVSIFRYPGEREYCEISALNMVELRMLCDPQYKTAVFIKMNVCYRRFF